MIRKKGTLTVEFLFSFTALICLSLYFFYAAFTLSLMEVAQYVTYASARELTLGQTGDDNEIKAEAKYNELKSKFFKTEMQPWISINNFEFIQESKGVKTQFISCIMALNIPFLGETISGQNASPCNGPAFTTTIASYLGPPAPSQKNCKDFLTTKRGAFLMREYQGGLPGTAQFPRDEMKNLGNGC